MHLLSKAEVRQVSAGICMGCVFTWACIFFGYSTSLLTLTAAEGTVIMFGVILTFGAGYLSQTYEES